MLRAIIIDDEADAIRGLKLLLEQCCPEVTVADSAQTLNQAQEVIQSQKPDLLFLDVELANTTGFELLKALDHQELLTIFVTAHSHYAIEAIKANAIDFILKPIESTDLIQAVAKATKRLQEKVFINYAQLLNDLNKMKPQRLEVPTRHGFRFIDFEKIEHIEADGNYSTLHLNDGSTLVVSRQLGSFENVLSASNFIRVHKSFIINLDHLMGFDRIEGGMVEMASGKRLDVSKKYKAHLLQSLKGIASKL